MLVIKSFYILTITTILVNASPTRRVDTIYHGDYIQSWSGNPYKFVTMLAGRSIALEQTRVKSPVTKYILIGEVYTAAKYEEASRSIAVNGHDFAIVKLKNSVDTTRYKVAMLTILARGQFSVDRTIHIVGYGKDSYRNERAGILKKGQTKLINCPRKIPPGEPICLKSAKDFSDQRSESGDSGGPALAKYKGRIIGIGVCSGFIQWSDGLLVTFYASTVKHVPLIEKHETHKNDIIPI